MMKVIVIVIVSIAVLACQSGPYQTELDAILEWYDPSASGKQMQEALDYLQTAAKDNPVICLEFARQLGPEGDTSLSGTSDVFRDPEHGCHTRLVQILRILRRTGDDDPYMYYFLRVQQLRENPELVEEILLRGDNGQASAMADKVSAAGLQEYIPLVVRSVRKRMWSPGEIVIQNRIFPFPWEILWGGSLLRFRELDQGEETDEGLREVLESLKNREQSEADDFGLTDDEREMMERIEQVLAED